MPTDLWYFHESDLNKDNLRTFFNGLPDHLQRMFFDSLGGLSNLDTHYFTVLQGYRGPYNNGSSGDSKYLGPSDGLYEVRYWWGASKKLLWVPHWWVSIRVFQDTNWHSLYFDSKTGECLSHDKNKAAEKLNNRGHKLFQEGKFAEAVEYFNNACQACSSGYKHEQTFEWNRDRAKEEEAAAVLNSLGERLFMEGKYTEALGKYQEAYLKSHYSKEYNKYWSNIEKAQAEADAANVNSEGDNLFSRAKYFEAFGKYQEACNKSRISEEYNKYRSNMERAQLEIEVVKINSEGDDLFSQSKYTEAHGKYQEAHDKSKNRNEFNKYSSNVQRAKAEIDAIELNSEGDRLFSRSKCIEALIKYQAAYDKSCVEKEKIKYASSINYVQALKNILSEIDTLWKEAWEAEKDFANDRSGEVKELFQKVLSETKDGLKSFPDNSRLKQYETLVSIKIEGIELFHEGLRAQQDCSKLLREAQELKQQQKFDSAAIKYKEAKSKFSEAQEKFKTGREKDRRFVSCIDFV